MSKLRRYHEKLNKRMFDFEDYYLGIAQELPGNAVIAEVGVADGASSVFLAEALLNYGKSKFKMYMIDSLDYGRQDQLGTLMKVIHEAGLAPWVELLPVDSLNASCRFPDDHFDFVFIDASHRFEFTKADIRLWHRKVKFETGILSGHDYNGKEGAEVKTAVDLVIPEDKLQIIPTTSGYNVWSVKARNYVKLNN